MVLVGRVGLEVKGAWDSSVAYATMDVVTYNNSTYIAKQAVPAGTLPTNTTYWELSLDASLLQTKTDGANKVASAVEGNFAAFDPNGDLKDSGLNIDVKGVDLDNAGVVLMKIGALAKAICVQQTVNITITTSSYTKVGTLPNGYGPSLKIETEISGNDRTLMLKIDTNRDISLKMLTGYSSTTMNIFAPFVWYS